MIAPLTGASGFATDLVKHKLAPSIETIIPGDVHNSRALRPLVSIHLYAGMVKITLASPIPQLSQSALMLA